MAAGKMQKLDPKQVPQVMGMTLLSVGLLAYVGMTLFGDTHKPPVTPTNQAKLVPAGGKSGTTAMANAAQPQGPLSGMQLPPVYNPNPFQPSKRFAAADPNHPVADKAPA